MTFNKDKDRLVITDHLNLSSSGSGRLPNEPDYFKRKDSVNRMRHLQTHCLVGKISLHDIPCVFTPFGLHQQLPIVPLLLAVEQVDAVHIFVRQVKLGPVCEHRVET